VERLASCGGNQENLQYAGEESTFEIEAEIRNRLNGSVTALQSLTEIFKLDVASTIGFQAAFCSCV
jgi:hypothetical protein